MTTLSRPMVGQRPKLSFEQYAELRRLAALPPHQRPKQGEVAARMGVTAAAISHALVRGIARYDRLLGTPRSRWRSPVRKTVVDYWTRLLCACVDEARAQP